MTTGRQKTVPMMAREIARVALLRLSTVATPKSSGPNARNKMGSALNAKSWCFFIENKLKN